MSDIIEYTPASASTRVTTPRPTSADERQAKNAPVVHVHISECARAAGLEGGKLHVDLALFRWVVLPAGLIGVPLQVIALRWTAVISLTLTALVGAVMVELSLAGWRRVPFTCTWIPGQRPLVFVLITSAAALTLTAGLLPALVVTAARNAGLLVILGITLATVAGLLRWRRVSTWANQPLLFEDERYDKLQVLGLTR